MCSFLQEVTDAKEVTLPSGVRYTDLVIGGGQRASPGLLMVLDLKCAEQVLAHFWFLAMHY